MLHLLRSLSFVLVLFITTLPVYADGLIPPEIEHYLNQHNLKLTSKAEDAQKTGYILTMGTGKGPRLAARRAAIVAAQRDIATLLAELPDRYKTATKQSIKTPTHTRTTVSGKVKQASPVFSFYQTDQKTFYLLMRKPLQNQR